MRSPAARSACSASHSRLTRWSTVWKGLSNPKRSTGTEHRLRSNKDRLVTAQSLAQSENVGCSTFGTGTQSHGGRKGGSLGADLEQRARGTGEHSPNSRSKAHG